MHVLYLIFNEGYATSSGPELQRRDLSSEAIRLTRAVHRLLPDAVEVAGLLALILLTDARRLARTTADGDLVPLAEQDRSLWDRAAIEEGTALVTAAFARGTVGFYQLQAATASLHDEAARAEQTDWPQILARYTVLRRLSDKPDGRAQSRHRSGHGSRYGPGARAARRARARRPAGGSPSPRRGPRASAGDAWRRDAAVVHYRRAAARTASLAELPHGKSCATQRVCLA